MGKCTPNNPDLGAPNSSLSAVDEGDSFTGVPGCGLCVVYAFKLEKRGARIRVALSEECQLFQVRFADRRYPR